MICSIFTTWADRALRVVGGSVSTASASISPIVLGESQALIGPTCRSGSPPAAAEVPNDQPCGREFAPDMGYRPKPADCFLVFRYCSATTQESCAQPIPASGPATVQLAGGRIHVLSIRISPVLRIRLVSGLLPISWIRLVRASLAALGGPITGATTRRRDPSALAAEGAEAP